MTSTATAKPVSVPQFDKTNGSTVDTHELTLSRTQTLPEAQWTKQTVTLNTGAKMPVFGLGTWQGKPEEVREAVKVALQSGYRHIDTATAYDNEHAVGQGIKDSGVPREEIWVTTKLDNPWHKRVEDGIENSLKLLGLDYIDLYLMHWPCPSDPATNLKTMHKDWTFIDTWKEMEKLPASGRVRNIGVSNVGITNMEKLLPHCTIIPAVDQVEVHPNNPSPRLVKYLQEKKIHITAYSCLGSTGAPIASDKTLARIAEKHGRTPQQVLITLALQRGFSVIPKSVTPSRIQSNAGIDGLILDDEDIETLNSLPERFKVCGDKWLPEGACMYFYDVDHKEYKLPKVRDGPDDKSVAPN